MLSPKILLAILGLLLAGGIVLLSIGWYVTGGLVTVLSLAFFYLWWRLNQIIEISTAISSENFTLARTKLDAIRKPEKLNAWSKTYYFFFLGMLEAQTNNFKPARAAFKVALDTNRFRAVDEKALALLMMAQLDARSRNNEGARRYIREARALEPGPQIREQINQLVKAARLRA